MVGYIFADLLKLHEPYLNGAGLSRAAHGVDEEKLLQAAAEALYERLGSSKGMVWCMDVIQKSFVRHMAPGRHMGCPELPTVRQPSNPLNCFT